MTTQLNIARDPSSLSTFITAFSDESKSLLLDPAVNATIAVPVDARFAVIYYDTGKDVFVSSSIITLPASASPVSNAGVLLKPSVDVSDPTFTTLNFMCIEAAYLSVEFYR